MCITGVESKQGRTWDYSKLRTHTAPRVVLCSQDLPCCSPLGRCVSSISSHPCTVWSTERSLRIQPCLQGVGFQEGALYDSSKFAHYSPLWLSLEGGHTPRALGGGAAMLGPAPDLLAVSWFTVKSSEVALQGYLVHKKMPPPRALQ